MERAGEALRMGRCVWDAACEALRVRRCVCERTGDILGSTLALTESGGTSTVHTIP